jgi:Peptide N-acetyl-beta-D-glucosaminyl asparaginase amidase A
MSRTFHVARNLAALLFIVTALIPSALASGPYKIGSANTVTADPNVTRPNTKPCVVQLFSDASFYDFNVEYFGYAPPAECPGPWAKVVLVADILLNAGIQYDRTANFWLGPVNIYFGTTAEPSPNLGPSWHIENDLTDYSPIFYTPQTGQADIGNIIGIDGLTSTIYASAALEFYPLAQGQAAPGSADRVYALSAGPSGGTVALNTTTSTLSAEFTLPMNIESAYLDVYSQSQSNDEFWYTCVPNDVATELESCGNTAFRETEITIDGQPAGVAPVFPWIFTGGIDPFLWFPIPGVQTLNFIPYRVNLTPFAGLLSNGQPHTVSLSVYNADSYFSATASLLLYLDKESGQTTGEITRNTLTAPSPTVTENLKVQSTSVTGTVDVSSNRSFEISGYVQTSHGKITTTVAQAVNFLSKQSFDVTSTLDEQNISQASSVFSETTTSKDGGLPSITSQYFNFPLTVDINELVLSNGNINLTTTADQNYTATEVASRGFGFPYTSAVVNTGQHKDTLELDSSFNILGNMNQSAAQQYNYFDSTGASYSCDLKAAANVLTSFSKGCL